MFILMLKNLVEPHSEWRMIPPLPHEGDASHLLSWGQILARLGQGLGDNFVILENKTEKQIFQNELQSVERRKDTWDDRHILTSVCCVPAAPPAPRCCPGNNFPCGKLSEEAGTCHCEPPTTEMQSGVTQPIFKILL